MTQSFFRRWITIVIVILQGVNTCAYANAGDVYSMQCSAGLGVPRDTTAALILSPDSGTVVEQFKGTTKRMVVCIQDVHCNAQAQKKIYEVLTVVTQHYGSAVHRICREGAWGTLDLTLLRDIENFHHPRIRDRVIQQLVRQGRMTGAEQFVFEAQLHGAGKNIDGVASAPSTHKAALQPVQLYGIEDAALYRRNRVLVTNALRTNDAVVVMVVGGYHTEGITQLLRAKGEGYVVIAPRVTAH